MNNPPAFPRSGFTDGKTMGNNSQSGMTLRDYFAAAAMQGMIAGSANPQAMGYPATDETANKAFQYADAMLKAREG